MNNLMSRLLLGGFWMGASMIAWSASVVAAGLAGAGHFSAPTDSRAFMTQAQRRAADHKGNLALILIENGEVADRHFQSRGRAVDEHTLFQLASLSKWTTAWGVMALVEDGKIDLDAPVETYLSRWQLPPGAYDSKGVTVRRLLSHMAGLTDGLSYCGFLPGVAVQPIEQSLTHAADACPGVDGRAQVGAAPGERWRYSGAGYTLLQLLIEEAAQEPFAAYMQRRVLLPLGMARSTYRSDEAAADLAEFFDADGRLTAHRRYTAVAAASLYSSAGDVARFLQAHGPGPGGEPPGRGVLSPQSLAAMRRVEARMLGSPFWGLGTRIYVGEGESGQVIGHDGGNAPAVNTTARIDLGSGDGIVVLATGSLEIASRLASEWTIPRRQGVNGLAILGEASRLAGWIGSGVLLIAVIGSWATWRAATRQRDKI